jgi:hypothetical protein
MASVVAIIICDCEFTPVGKSTSWYTILT